MTTKEILQNAYVITNGGGRLDQFRRTFNAVGLDASLVKEWKACMIPANGLLGAATSHYSLVRFAREADLPWLVVFEDDAVPADAASEEIEKEFEAHREDGTLCLSLGWSYDSDPDKGEDRAAKRIVYGAQAYILFGRKAYDAYMAAYEKNGYSPDWTVALIDGSKMTKENLFAQHTPGQAVHASADSWSIDAEMEKAVNGEAGSKLSKARAEIAKMKAENAVHVAWTVDIQGPGAAQFGDQIYVSVKSVRDTRKPGDYVVAHILYSHVSVELMERLHSLERDGFKVVTRRIDDRDLNYWQQFSRHDPKGAARPWGGIVFARIWLPLFLKDCDRCVYLDSDTMCRAPISDLYHGTIPEGKLLGMNMGSVPEYGYNSGVMLMDLKAMRADETLYTRLDDFMRKNTRGFYCPDQTTINRFFAGKIADIERKWNYPPTPGCADPEMAKAKLWHFYNGQQKPYRLAADDAGRALVVWNNVLTQGEKQG